MKSTAQESLVRILQEGIDVHRCAAARALGAISGPESVEVLSQALMDEDPDVRVDAANALSQIGDPAAAEVLMKNLIGDPDSGVKRAALSALVDFRYEPVLPLLRKLAISRTNEIAWDEDEFYSEGWDSWVDLQLAAIKGLAAFGSQEAVLDILEAMSDEMGQDVSEAGVIAMAALGEGGAEALDGLYPLSDLVLRRRIANAVLASDNPHVAPLIGRFMEDEHARLREIVATGLAPDDARLETLFEDADATVRAAVVRHAGAHFPERVTALIPDPDAKVRAEVFRVIAADPGAYPGEDLATTVQQAIAGDPEAAREAALALVALRGKKAIKGLTHTMTNAEIPLEFRLGAIEAMKSAGPISVPYLLRAAGDDARQMRLASLGALVDFAANDPIWPNAAGEGLLAALRGELVVAPVETPEEREARELAEAEEEARVEAEARAEFDAAAEEEEQEVDASFPLAATPLAPEGSTLDKIMTGGSNAPIEVKESEPVEMTEKDLQFLELSKQRKMSKRKMSLESTVAPHLDVRRFAATLLGGVPNSEVTSDLIAVLAAEDTELHTEALASLAQHGDSLGTLPAEALIPLLEQLNSPLSETRVLALRALGLVAEESIDDSLRAHLTDADPFVRVEAVRALGNRGVVDDTIEACLTDEYYGVGVAAATALANVRGQDAVDALINFAAQHDGTYRRDVGRMLGEFTGDAGIESLIAFMNDDTRLRDRLVAIDALAEAFAYRDQNKERKVA